MEGDIKNTLLAIAAVLTCACNSAPQGTSCVPFGRAVASAGAAAPPACNGVCQTVVETTDGGPDGGVSLEVCIVDCTDGGNAVCAAGTTCTSGAPIGVASSYCLIACSDAGVCPYSLACFDGGVCL
jgi:hypothetical protein